MYGYDFNTEKQANDNVKVNDGTLTYYTNDEGNGIESVARSFYSSYDFNLDDDETFEAVRGTVEHLETGETADFTGDTQGNFEWN